MILDRTLAMSNADFDKVSQETTPDKTIYKIVKEREQERLDRFSDKEVEPWILKLIQSK